MIGDKVREEFFHFSGSDHRRVDADALLVGDVAAQFIFMLAFCDLHEARLNESAFAANAFLPIAEVLLVAFEGQFGFGGEVIVHADKSARMPGRA